MHVKVRPGFDHGRSIPGLLFGFVLSLLLSMKHLHFILIVLALTACASNKDEPLSKAEKTFAQVYAELAHLKYQTPPPAQTVYLDSCKAILNRHGFTQKYYQQTVDHLQRQPVRWRVFYQEVLRQLDSPPKKP
jgi:hypothetical protein